MSDVATPNNNGYRRKTWSHAGIAYQLNLAGKQLPILPIQIFQKVPIYRLTDILVN